MKPRQLYYNIKYESMDFYAQFSDGLDLFAMALLIQTKYTSSCITNVTVNRIREILHCNKDKAGKLLKRAMLDKTLFRYDEKRRILYVKSMRGLMRKSRKTLSDYVYKIERYKIGGIRKENNKDFIENTGLKLKDLVHLLKVIMVKKNLRQRENCLKQRVHNSNTKSNVNQKPKRLSISTLSTLSHLPRTTVHRIIKKLTQNNDIEKTLSEKRTYGCNTLDNYNKMIEDIKNIPFFPVIDKKHDWLMAISTCAYRLTNDVDEKRFMHKIYHYHKNTPKFKKINLERNFITNEEND